MASRFINYRKMRELTEAAKNGNAAAKNIIDQYMGDQPDMEIIEGLINDYYGNAGIDTLAKVEDPHDEDEELELQGISETFDEGTDGKTDELTQQAQESIGDGMEQTLDISADLDRELDGLVDSDQP